MEHYHYISFKIRDKLTDLLTFQGKKAIIRSMHREHMEKEPHVNEQSNCKKN